MLSLTDRSLQKEQWWRREAVSCGRQADGELERSKGSGSSGNVGLHGQVSPWQAPEGVSNLQEQDTCSSISLSLSAILLFFLANTPCFVLKELFVIRKYKVLGSQKRSICRCHARQKGGSNLESVSWKDPAAGTRRSDIPRD